LIDHELLSAPHEGTLKRVAAFGWYAGAVGAGEALHLTGLALLRKGIATPLLVSGDINSLADGSTYLDHIPSIPLKITKPA